MSMSAEPVPASPDGLWHYMIVGEDTGYPPTGTRCVTWSGPDPMTAPKLIEVSQGNEVSPRQVLLLCAPHESLWAR